MLDIEGAITPSQLVERFAKAGIRISERTLRERARQLGAYRQMGKTMFFMPEDVEAIVEASKPESKKRTEATPAVSTWTEADTNALIDRLTKRKPRGRPKT